IHNIGKLTVSGEVNNKPAELLIDSGADDNFIGKEKAKQLGLPLVKLEEAYSVSVTGGEQYVVEFTVENVPIKLQGFESLATFQVLPVPLELTILGARWLYSTNPMIDWREKTITLKPQDRRTPIVIRPEKHTSIRKATPKELNKLTKQQLN